MSTKKIQRSVVVYLYESEDSGSESETEESCICIGNGKAPLPGKNARRSAIPRNARFPQLPWLGRSYYSRAPGRYRGGSSDLFIILDASYIYFFFVSFYT